MFGVGTARSLAGIYRELRQLRRLAESYFQYAEIPLPETPYERLKSTLVAAGRTTEPEIHQPEFDEEREARSKSEQIVQDIAAGRDPGTPYRPW